MRHLDVLNDQVIGVETLVLGVALGVLRGIDNDWLRINQEHIVFQRGYLLYNIYLEHVQQELGGLDWPPANAQVEEKKQSLWHCHYYDVLQV